PDYVNIGDTGGAPADNRGDGGAPANFNKGDGGGISKQDSHADHF
ncbi:Phr family secreted Rap phosphatase inhibitor, partial [Bacillus wiedmannii]